MDFLSIFALLLLFSIGIALAYSLIIIHDIPYKIAKKRNHPHAEAIEAAGWVSLFLMHAIWPFLWIWAMLYHPQKGFGTGAETLPAGKVSNPEQGEDSAILKERLRDLEQRLAAMEAPAGGKAGSQPHDSTAAG